MNIEGATPLPDRIPSWPPDSVSDDTNADPQQMGQMTYPGTLELSGPEHFVTALSTMSTGAMVGCACGDLLLLRQGDIVTGWAKHRAEPV